MNNSNKHNFKFENTHGQKITLVFIRTNENGYYDIAFMKNKHMLLPSTGWHYLNNYLDTNPFRQEIQHLLYEKIKYKVFHHQSCYTEEQTGEIIEILESVRIMSLLMR